jgi:signal transduction histidine kinase
MASTETVMTQKNRSPKISLRLLLVVPFLLQIFGAVALVGYFSFKNGQKAVDNLANQLIDRTSQQVGDHIETYTSLPAKLAEMNQQAIANGELDLDNTVTAGQHFWRQSKAFPDINGIGFTLEDGIEVGSGRWADGSNFVVYHAENGQSKEYLADAVGKPGKLVLSYEYDGTEEPWFQATLDANQLIWGVVEITQLEGVENHNLDIQQSVDLNSNTIYERFEDGTVYYVATGVTIPIQDGRTQRKGVSFVDLTLHGISGYLRTLNVSSQGRTWVMERDGELVGTSTQHRLIYKSKDQASTETAEVKRHTVLSYPDSTIQSVGRSLQQQFKSLETIQTEQALRLNINGKPHYVRVIPQQDQYDLDWLVVIAIPESDFMAQIHASTQTTIFLCIGALVLASCLGLYTSRWIIRPIAQLNDSSAALANRQLDQTITPSPIVELDSLGQSFNHMAQQLQASFTALEQTNEHLEERVSDRTAELSQALQDLQSMQAQLIQQEKMSSLGQLVAGVAHEINNPVNFIAANLKYTEQYSQDLMDLIQLYQQQYPQTNSAIQTKIKQIDLDYLQRDLPNILKSMQVGSSRISDIVLSLRNFSRLDESALKTVDIHEGLESTLLILQHRLQGDGHRCANHCAIALQRDYASLPSVNCYPGQLNQVFMNILVNAIDALEEQIADGSTFIPTITLRTTVVDENWIEVAIADNGTGIPADIQQRIFDPFFTTKPVGKGTGMGMSISYKIITETHRGKIRCCSQVGQGSEFVIQIPIDQTSQT